ncbi:sodium:calcium antiporter [Candidatus Woesearchaeota archaeon]|nr:sodium:calcium antiporter [Candidatus Woesearchaeota archaeon]
MIITNLLFFGLSTLVMIISSIFLVKSLDKIATFLRIAEYTAAFIIMAVATSLPELFVGISSALIGLPSLSLGNIIGANIIDITLIMGIFVLMGRGITVKKERTGKDIYFVLGSIILFIILFFIGNSLSRVDGAILILLFVINSVRMIKKRKKYSLKYIPQKRSKRLDIITAVLIFIFSLATLFITSKFVVGYASIFAEELKVPPIFIGLFLLSFATTLPEMIFGIQAIKTQHKSMAIGDQTGTIFVNMTLILGVVALISPIETTLTPFFVSAIFLFVSTFIFVTFVKSEHKLTIWEGLSLIFIYILFIILEFFAK